MEDRFFAKEELQAFSKDFSDLTMEPSDRASGW